MIIPQYIVVESPIIQIQGQVLHQDVSTCSLIMEIPDQSLTIDSITIQVQADGSFTHLLTGLDEREESFIISSMAICGEYTETVSYSNTSVMIVENNDIDGDGILDEIDLCPDGIGESDGWASSSSSDVDQDGCRDYDEDADDDNDGVLDINDSCASTIGWLSNQENDRDQDGCMDDGIDADDDGDGILDEVDSCNDGEINWPANLYLDWDQDGCHDLLEDSDDDNDGENDSSDLCPKGRTNWILQRNVNTDFDMDGCFDTTEDDDDDNDAVNDFNATGSILDQCPYTPLGASDVDEYGCAAIERDTDSDGINDLLDQCEGTPTGLTVNAAGCADLDGDGVFANVDICADSPSRWTIDNQGCAINQRSVPWTSGTTVNGPMDIVPTFTVPTLDGTFTFQNKWTGDDVYLFMFKYTDSSGNSKSGTWATNPGTFIRNLPSNTHLFYGSFDSTYHND